MPTIMPRARKQPVLKSSTNFQDALQTQHWQQRGEQLVELKAVPERRAEIAFSKSRVRSTRRPPTSAHSHCAHGLAGANPGNSSARGAGDGASPRSSALKSSHLAPLRNALHHHDQQPVARGLGQTLAGRPGRWCGPRLRTNGRDALEPIRKTRIMPVFLEFDAFISHAQPGASQQAGPGPFSRAHCA
jgi:hypothetical protein